MAADRLLPKKCLKGVPAQLQLTSHRSLRRFLIMRNLVLPQTSHLRATLYSSGCFKKTWRAWQTFLLHRTFQRAIACLPALDHPVETVDQGAVGAAPHVIHLRAHTAVRLLASP